MIITVNEFPKVVVSKDIGEYKICNNMEELVACISFCRYYEYDYTVMSLEDLNNSSN